VNGRSKSAIPKGKKARSEWTLPYRPGAPPAEDDFCAKAGAIWDEYRERKRNFPVRGERGLARGKPDASLPPFDTPMGFFKRQSFGLLYSYALRAEDRAIIKKLVMRSTYQPERPSFRENFFHWGMVAIYLVEGVSGAREVASARKRSGGWERRWPMLILNEVPPKHLIGFIYQSACSERIGKLLRQRSRDPSLTFQVLEPALRDG
jgi:hypothetical protein